MKRDSTSMEAMNPPEGVVLRASRNSADDFRLNLSGTYGVRMAFSFLASWYVGAGI